ncbi:hypothetical protein V2J09_013019 [Rumex salicifolius]
MYAKPRRQNSEFDHDTQLWGSHAQLSNSESRILLQIQKHLEYPEAIKGWNRWTNFCYLPSSSSVIVVCSGNHVTELTLIGTKNSSQSTKQGSNFVDSQQSLSESFSIDSLFTAVTKLSALKRLSLVSLGLWGPIPSKISRLSSLQMLNMSSNFIYGSIPSSIASLVNLQSIVLSSNLINGSVPDLTGLESLKELDLGSNRIGPEFPSLGSNLVYIKLQKNSFRSKVPSQFNNFYVLQWLDVSSNHLVGPIPSFIFSLPALWYLNLAGNQLTGAIPKGTSCGGKLWIVDISSNHLIGNLPSCMGSKATNKNVYSSWNCLSGAKYQHTLSYCQRQALAVKPPSKHHSEKEENQQDSRVNLGIVIAITIGIVVVICVGVGMLVWVICRKRISSNAGSKNDDSQDSAKTSTRTAAPTANSKYTPRTLRMAAHSLPPFYDFTLEELEEAAGGFDQENLVRDEGSQGQIYKGLLRSGSTVLIKSIKMKHKHSAKSMKQHMELISQLRHQNLVSIIGHCIATSQDRNNKGSTIFVVFENVPNGSLRDHLTDWRRKERLKWPQRMTISMGIARGVHFLHTGTTPRVFGNDLKIENVLLDESLTPKVSSYRIPLPPKEAGDCSSDTSNAEKDDIYMLGVILIELLTGKQVSSESEIDELKQELESSLGESATVLQQAVDSSLRGTFAYQSLRTATEITINCLNKEPSRRPSMEDVLWYLQYSIQVQQTWTSSGNLGLNSGNLSMHLQK